LTHGKAYAKGGKTEQPLAKGKIGNTSHGFIMSGTKRPQQIKKRIVKEFCFMFLGRSGWRENIKHRNWKKKKGDAAHLTGEQIDVLFWIIYICLTNQTNH